MRGTRPTGARRPLALLAGLASLCVALALPASAPAPPPPPVTVTIAPTTPIATNSFPFGQGDIWTPQMGFVYKNLPAFTLKQNDLLAFDLGAVNDADIQLKLEMAPTSVNGGMDPAGAFTTIVSNTQTPASPRGDVITGNYELSFRVEGPFSFPGGGLIIRASSPGAALAADATGTPVLFNGGGSGDASNLFVGRFFGDADGLPPYSSSDAIDVAAFRLTVFAAPDILPLPNTNKKKKKCKAKKKGKAKSSKAKKKRCKKGKRKK